ncbi:MAG TPA: ABC transporter ATP-binding protein [Verrucomicrobiae bacterium]|nr:ABC transporter ATP-binding protein [Verrucomicrobiae bacterium]
MIQFIKHLIPLVKPYRFRLGLGVFFGILAGFVEPLAIVVATGVFQLIFTPEAISAESVLKGLPPFARELVPQFVLDWLTTVQKALAGSDIRTNLGAVIILVSLIPFVMFLRGLLGYLNSYCLQWVSIRAVTDLRVRLFEHLMSLSSGFFAKTNTGELMSRTMMDTGTLQNIISNATVTIIKDPATLIGLVALLLWKAPGLTAISIIVMPLCVIPIIIYGRKGRRSARKMQNELAGLSSVMTEAFTGFRIIKAYNLERTVTAQFRSASSKVVGLFMRIVRSIETPGPLLETCGSVGVALVFLYLVLRGNKQIDYGDFIIMLGSMYSMYRPIKQLARLQNNLLQAQAASERVFELLATQSSIPEPANPRPLQAAGAEVTFEHVEFAYGEKTVVRDVTLTVKPGQLVALVGHSGSGKTTLTNLLLRFYDPQKGSIRIGGVDIRDVATSELRSQIAVVIQETILFNDTIRNNIALGRPGASEADIIEAAKHAHAHEFIVEQPDGYNTVIGEKGVNLSGGQRQRLAIARAVIKDAPILILDEATNALDPQIEREVQAVLDELMVGRTTFCIAHRFSTILHADLIVVMDQGRIVETGTHDELIKLGGVYQKLYALQFKT